MESIIEQIYYGNIREFDRKRVSNSDAELQAYEAIFSPPLPPLIPSKTSFNPRKTHFYPFYF